MNLKHGYPFSLIKNGLPFGYPKLAETRKADVAIIGGGISGALTAYELTEAGVDCVLVDSRSIGLGSTCASTSLLQYELDIPLCRLAEITGKKAAERAYILCHESIDELEKICRKVKHTTFERKQSVYYAAYKKHLPLIREEFEARKNAGLPVTLLENKEVHQKLGFEAPAAILSSQAASVDGYLLTHHLLQYSIRKGLRVFDRTHIEKISYGRKLLLKTSDGHEIHAKYIVNATGYEVTDFINKGIVTLHSTYALVSEQFNDRPAFPRDTLVWNTADPYLYMRETHDNRIIAGGRDEPFYNPAKRDKLLRKKSLQLTDDVMKLFPDMDFLPEFSWTGTFGKTADALPYIGTYKKMPGTYFALGFGGNGITFSYIAARIITDLLTGKNNKDVQLFSFDRT